MNIIAMDNKLSIFLIINTFKSFVNNMVIFLSLIITLFKGTLISTI